MADFNEDDDGSDLFGFVTADSSETKSGQGGVIPTGLEVPEGVFTGPNKDAVIFCIDCANIGDIMKVVSSDGTDMTGLIFYNVAVGENPLNQRGIYVVQDIAPITARRIQEIRTLRSMTPESFISRFGGLDECGVSELLFVCNSQFKRTSSAYRARLFIFTSNDDPCGTDRRARKAALTRANDFHEGMSTGAEINLIPLMIGEKKNFDILKFWDKLVLLSAPDEQFVENSLIQLTEMQQVVLRKVFRKRPLNRVDFFLSPLVKISLMIYTSMFPAGRPRHIYVDPENYQPLRSETRYVSEFTGAVLEPLVGEMKTFVDFEGRAVPMTKEEIIKIKRMDEVAGGLGDDGLGGEGVTRNVTGRLTLIGFKPIECISAFHSVGHSCFLVPQDSRIAGSGQTCGALISRLAARNLVAICSFIAKANSAPMLAALIPQLEQMSENGRQEKSPGFHLVRIPFADDVRDLSLPGTNVAATCESPSLEAARRTQVESAKRVVEAMSENFWDPDVLDNPALQQCYIVLEAMALNLDANEVGAVHDLVGPDPAKVALAEHTGVPVWLQALGISDDSTQLGKRAKAEKPKPDIKLEASQVSEETVRAMIADGTFERFTVDALKELIRNLPVFENLTTSGRKAELITKIKFALAL